MKSLLTTLALVLLLYSCSESGKQMMNKNITGKAGELVIVTANS